MYHNGLVSVTDLTTFQTVGYSRKQYQLNIPHTDHRQTQFHGVTTATELQKLILYAALMP